MKTEADAKRVVDLYSERKRLKVAAAIFGEASRVSVSTVDYHFKDMQIEFSHLKVDLLALIGKEVDLRVAAIDTELATLGFDPGQPSSDDD